MHLYWLCKPKVSSFEWFYNNYFSLEKDTLRSSIVTESTSWLLSCLPRMLLSSSSSLSYLPLVSLLFPILDCYWLSVGKKLTARGRKGKKEGVNDKRESQRTLSRNVYASTNDDDNILLLTIQKVNTAPFFLIFLRRRSFPNTFFHKALQRETFRVKLLQLNEMIVNRREEWRNELTEFFLFIYKKVFRSKIVVCFPSRLWTFRVQAFTVRSLTL